MTRAEAFVKLIDPDMYQSVIKLTSNLLKDPLLESFHNNFNDLEQYMRDIGMQSAARLILERIQKSLDLKE